MCHLPQQHDKISITGKTSQSIDPFTANKLYFLPENTHKRVKITKDFRDIRTSDNYNFKILMRVKNCKNNT